MSCPDPALAGGERSHLDPGTLEAAAASSRDAFYGGRFMLCQPRGRGFRSGLDALLLAACLPADASGDAVDLGSGAGAVGFAAACRCPALRLTLVEVDPGMAGLCRQGLDLPDNAGFADRLRMVEADATAPRAIREAAGLHDGAFGTVLSNPPFNPQHHRRSADHLRARALSVADPAFLPRWIAVAAALLKPGGTLAMVLRPENLPAVLGSAGNRLGDLRIVPVQARSGEAAMRILLRAVRGSRAPLSIRPSIVLHEADGSPSETGIAIAAGAMTVDFGT
ncbi:methyltransferase [Mangrovicella endophytica]|uniref:methyltransferase n=1 Tax=Mangrovicella endophytica TaxID=2066697 RepID=UPI000C9DE0DF|nr:methyltransferase [Mangrovicella endophytica]